MNRSFDVASVQKGAATMLVDGVAIVLQTLVRARLLAFYHPFLLGFDIVLIASITVVVGVLGMQNGDLMARVRARAPRRSRSPISKRVESTFASSSAS